MRNGVEKGPDIKIQHPILSPAPAAAYGQRVMGAAPRTVPVAVPVEDRLQLLLQQHRRRRLRHPVARVGDGGFILLILAVTFLDVRACRACAAWCWFRCCHGAPTFESPVSGVRGAWFAGLRG